MPDVEKPATCGSIEDFEVEYDYYQYNSGAADNGSYRQTRRFAKESEARDLAQRIAADIKARKQDYADNEDDDLRTDLIPYAGYFLGVRAYRVTREPLWIL